MNEAASSIATREGGVGFYLAGTLSSFRRSSNDAFLIAIGHQPVVEWVNNIRPRFTGSYVHPFCFQPATVNSLVAKPKG